MLGWLRTIARPLQPKRPLASRGMRLLRGRYDAASTNADNRRMVELLEADGFSGFLSVELINPVDPEAVLANHIAQFNILKETCRVQ